MALVEWNDRLRVGIGSIDIQHMQLVALINCLHEAMLERRGQARLSSILSELIEYTESHFAYEEQLFVTHGYRLTAEHRLQHAELARQVKEFADSVNAGRVALSGPVLEFLTHWLTDHICGEDQKYVRFLMAKGVR